MMRTEFDKTLGPLPVQLLGGMSSLPNIQPGYTTGGYIITLRGSIASGYGNDCDADNLTGLNHPASKHRLIGVGFGIRH